MEAETERSWEVKEGLRGRCQSPIGVVAVPMRCVVEGVLDIFHEIQHFRVD